jgi:hypothetical protein
MNGYIVPSLQTLNCESLRFIPKTQTGLELGACGGGEGCDAGTISDVPFLFCTFNLEDAADLNGSTFFLGCTPSFNFTLSNCQFTNVEDCSTVGGGTLVQCLIEDVNCDAVSSACGGPPSSVGIIVNDELVPCNVMAG